MVHHMSLKQRLTESINLGLITVVVAALITVVSGFSAAMYSDGEAMLTAARAMTYPVAPYFVFMLIGFAVFNSSRRRPITTLMFNIFAAVLFIEIVSILMVAMAKFDDMTLMISDVYAQNFVLSMIVLVLFVMVAYAAGRKGSEVEHNS